MELSTLSILVKNSQVNRFQYQVEVKYAGKKWTKHKSFAEFEQLQDTLLRNNYSDVPFLPDVNFAAGFGALDELHHAESSLQEFLLELFRRPDTRSSIDVLTFVDLLQHLKEVPKPVAAEYLTGTEAYNLSVSDYVCLEEDSLLIVSYEEKTVLSKLGRLWSIIEPDVIGAIRIFSFEKGIKKGFNLELHMDFIAKVRCMAYDKDTSTLFVATGDGYVKRFKLIKAAKPKEVTLEFLDEVLIHENAILTISLKSNLYYTCGYDGNIRRVEVKTNKVIGGGKLSKRLNGDKLMTSETTSDDVMIVGTTGNVLHMYYMGKEIPQFIQSVSIPQPCTIHKIVTNQKNVFVAHGNCISCYSLAKAQVDPDQGPRSNAHVIELSSIRKVSTKNSEIVNVSIPMSIRSAQFSINSVGSSFAAYNVYDFVIRSTSRQIIAAYDQVHFIHLIRDGNTLISGGSDGDVRVWKLPNDDDLVLWSPSRS
ncbi:hypothetical protein BEWA_024850 [Theileria equi strain WA]|uniref:PX domain-containing protein n=1 Tax=Theileria equi strain WA TaxID=1537102 RepID=L0AX86_THEEQ|nr:hypothetical protein BEWA_024850 [Theileria equi strain WA]AFZ79636.1 hypothetical protein BEWA_024850 [Theileria equi strain WA]|eukprot:XP_004829302.1 hypothetical protein BEWA_024850 [Theileria equi strain WA]